jgi:hypothetical protein
MIFVSILVSFEMIGKVVLEERDTCYTGLLSNGIYENAKPSELKQLCNDYGKILYYEYPTKHLLPNQHTNTVHINNEGFRGPDIIKEKNEDVFRIFVLGGSLTYGMFATSDETTYSGYLQKKFDESSEEYNIEIINAGVNAYDSSDVSYQIKTKLLDYQPDLFIIITGNDVDRTSKQDSVDVPFYYSLSNQFTGLKLYYKSPEFFEFIKRVVLKNTYGDQGIPGESVNHESLEDKIKLWKERWMDICDFSNGGGIDVVLAIPPILGAGNKPPSEWELQNLEKLSHNSITPSYHLVKNSLAELDKRCSNTLDLTNTFDHYENTIYLDNQHVGDMGNMLIADELFRFLLPIIDEKILRDKNLDV